MSKVFIQEDTLTNIANAIREKDGTTDPIAPQNMADAIINLPSGGEEVEPIVLTGNISHQASGAIASKYIELYGNTISTNNITNLNNTFYKTTLEKVPFAINCQSGTGIDAEGMFEGSKIKNPPYINNLTVYNLKRMFASCYFIREFPENYFDNWNWYNQRDTISEQSKMFGSCYSLRKLPENFLKNCWNKSSSYSRHITYEGFTWCMSLDDIVGLGVNTITTITSNIFSSCFSNCCRLKDFTFETNDDGTPKITKWSNQRISLEHYVGYTNSPKNILNYNSGITADKEVKDDATYQALKNDPDWFSTNINYSRYNHDSVVRTINSLPDTSAYLATTGATNTITFKGASGALTDGGAINTLTEEEIAVATVKGWTVSFV